MPAKVAESADELLKPDQIVAIPFEFFWMAQRIPAGARLRLTIAPLNSAAYQKNYNTCGRIGYERLEDARVAYIKVFHDAEHASQLTLPLAALVSTLHSNENAMRRSSVSRREFLRCAGAGVVGLDLLK